jgi:hypothetical protein
MKYKCPCCDNFTLSEPGGGSYEICKVCYWQDDNVQFANPDFGGGPNEGVSLNAARQNYLQHGVFLSKWLPNVRPPLPDELPENNG